MIPLVDMHCHLLAGLDDGPKSEDNALEMCRISYSEGIRVSAALAHQNETWPAVTPQVILEHVNKLELALRRENIALSVFACGEIMVQPDIEAAWLRGDLLSIADKKRYLLIEMPQGLFVDLRSIIQGLQEVRVRPILAHPERQPELLQEPGVIEQLIDAGCIIQVNSSSITEPASRQDAKALEDWFRRGIVHVLGSDGHSPRRRRPQMAQAYQQIVRWAGERVAERICNSNPTAIVQGFPLRLLPPQPQGKRWFPFW